MIPFKIGYYAYVGSAFGAGGLAARINHHLSISNRPRWHIDYLRQKASIEQIWLTESSQKLEHDWARLLSQMDHARITVEGFGASDCRCASHLFYFRYRPSVSKFGDGITSYRRSSPEQILTGKVASFQINAL
ncbi:GIY-YIG nuclease family protein [candidate division KSB1 bacterium]|nr:GIY-YIG nuclease family protein [candidate division KSB1 bacterium]NIR69973.1 GIY-YIG nuclease family protein [candidate division KSB1 bacterium]NIS25872.1 GIY-YIG nuclease family protein [candidate division KSB1 bacterium]NIT72749.1 GIY-YIG nuclease family protein [candidate division KSB1 bacterium]NIU26561.1 GIY-YIG nuclease family protein [candidate division KSB1 bacterium]